MVVKSHSSTIILWFSYGFRQLGKSSISMVHGPHGATARKASSPRCASCWLPPVSSDSPEFRGMPSQPVNGLTTKGKSKPETKAFPMISMGCSCISFLKNQPIEIVMMEKPRIWTLPSGRRLQPSMVYITMLFMGKLR